MPQIDYATLEHEILQILDRNKVMVLATCADERVTARAMSVIHDGLHILFQTDLNFLKAQQIRKNPNVALCVDNMEYEGKARLRGHPLEEPFFAAEYQRRHPGSYARYSPIQTNVVIEVTPRLITLWKYMPDATRDFLEPATGKAWREPYDAR